MHHSNYHSVFHLDIEIQQLVGYSDGKTKNLKLAIKIVENKEKDCDNCGVTRWVL
jgi:hypothetical protein